MNKLSIIIASSGIQFGTSGARGLVIDFTPTVCSAFSYAFISVLKKRYSFDKIALAIDNRPSSYCIAKYCAAALSDLGIETVYYGVIPTPALAYQAMKDNIPGIMVTGSHIPYDRNGLKFYTPEGEITKADEQEILLEDVLCSQPKAYPELQVNKKAAESYCSRYISLFDNTVFKGARIGIYEHSSAGRDFYHYIFKALGADVISLGRCDDFIPIDTEAVAEDDRAKAKEWARKYNLDAIFSTDGDGDRPLLADENGEWLRGDVLGFLAAEALSIEALAIPINCNTSIFESKRFDEVLLTKIGSPYVIEKINLVKKHYSRVAGFEANGGFILGSELLFNGTKIDALPTRDALLPVIVILFAASKKNSYISKMVSELPRRFTLSDRVKDIPNEHSLNILNLLSKDPSHFFRNVGFTNYNVAKVNELDGLRIIFDNNDIIHLRASGNAPELRCYVESDDERRAKSIIDSTLKYISKI